MLRGASVHRFGAPVLSLDAVGRTPAIPSGPRRGRGSSIPATTTLTLAASTLDVPVIILT